MLSRFRQSLVTLLEKVGNSGFYYIVSINRISEPIKNYTPLNSYEIGLRVCPLVAKLYTDPHIKSRRKNV